MDETTLKCFALLNLPADASSEDIEVAYQRLSRDIQNGSLPWEQSKEILWAYDYLRNYESKQLNEPPDSERVTQSLHLDNRGLQKTRSHWWIYAIFFLFSILSISLYFSRGPLELGFLRSGNMDTTVIVKKVKPAIVTIRVGESVSGSGFVVSRDGYIVTNAHVMQEKNGIAIFADGFRTSVNLVMLDEERDFALLKASEVKEYPYLTLGDSNKSSEGDTVIAAGTPMNFESSFTKGIISSTRRSFPFLRANLIQTDAAINFGNSGGPLINHSGDIIGINSLIVRGRATEGIGFAVAINDVRNHIERKQQMTDDELSRAIAREERKMEEIRTYRDDSEMRAEKGVKERIIEEQWERERRRREFNEKVEAANRELQEKKEVIEKRLHEESEGYQKRFRENAESKRKALSDCLQGVTNQYQRNWNEHCVKLSQQDNCTLPFNTANLLEQRLAQLRNECYRLNGQ